LSYVGGMAGSFIGMAAGFALAWGGSGAGAVLFFASSGGVIFFYIASFVRAIKVAKVKNMAIRDKKFSLNFSPKIELQNRCTPANTIGIQLAVRF